MKTAALDTSKRGVVNSIKTAALDTAKPGIVRLRLDRNAIINIFLIFIKVR